MVESSTLFELSFPVATFNKCPRRGNHLRLVASCPDADRVQVEKHLSYPANSPHVPLKLVAG